MNAGRPWSRKVEITDAGRYQAAEEITYFQSWVRVYGKARRSGMEPQRRVRKVVAEVCLARSVLDPAGAQQELYEQISAELSADIKMRVLEVSLVPESASVAFARRLEAVLRRREELDQTRREIFADPVRAALWFVDGRPDRMLTLADLPSAAAFDEARERLSGSLGIREHQSFFEVVDRARELDPRLWAYAIGKLATALRELGAESMAAALEREIQDG